MKKLAVILVFVLLLVAAFSLAACYDKYEPAVWFKPIFYYYEGDSEVEYEFPMEIVFDDKTDKIEITVDYVTEDVRFNKGMVRVPGDPRYNSWFIPAQVHNIDIDLDTSLDKTYRYIERYGNVPDPYTAIDTPGKYFRVYDIDSGGQFPDREVTLIINVKATK